ncbi:MAG: MoxR family ATPase [bacterium]|nr:MoxR family ATPase [bacterium]
MSESVNIRELNDLISSKSGFVSLITRGMDQTIVGQKHLVDSLLIALLANGHVLLEGVPGLAKTLAIKTLSSLIDAKFSRIQFTPDLLPADVIGTMVYSVKNEKFEVKKGPIFANFILADEINRAPAKVQSALLEAMQERQVTIGDRTFALDNPFLVLATQNPIEQEGTYPLPEAQVDRFLMKVIIGYPSREEEKLIVRQNIAAIKHNVEALVKPEEILEIRKIVEQIYIDEKIERYIVDIVFATRFPSDYGLNDLTSIISFGASPRASISMAIAARAYAFLKGRGYVIPEDVRAICHDVLRHRIGLSYEAEANNISADEVVSQILDKIAVP